MRHVRTAIPKNSPLVGRIRGRPSNEPVFRVSIKKGRVFHSNGRTQISIQCRKKLWP